MSVMWDALLSEVLSEGAGKPPLSPMPESHVGRGAGCWEDLGGGYYLTPFQRECDALMREPPVIQGTFCRKVGKRRGLGG